ncbi:MAG: hypothetical protein V2J02_14795 [Pseudomonadales bacterium]|jgi:hypothetical protein|nr:hypothetical protein [Pseudomonadales bacterium]
MSRGADTALAAYVSELLVETEGAAVPEPPAPAMDATSAQQAEPSSVAPAPAPVPAVGPDALAVWRLPVPGGVDLALDAGAVDRELEPSPVDANGAAGIRIGTVAVEGRSLPLVDPARLLRPDAPEPTPARWLLCADLGLVLRVDATAEPAALERAAVVWRGAGGARPWLAGTAPTARCALIDPDGLAASLP